MDEVNDHEAMLRERRYSG